MEILDETREIHEELGQFAEFFLRLQGTFRKGSIWGACPSWITKNTKLNGEQFSFRDHEFQIAIAGDECQKVSVKKCSQVGLSELSVRVSLAFLGISNGKSLIYILPTTRFATKFAKTRIDPVVEGSQKLSQMLISASDSSEMKRFGNSILYINGASTQGQAISMPADVLVRDEYDFCDPMILTTYASRLRHAENGGYIRDFSTPTVGEYGIALEYERGDQKRYFVQCEHCGCRHAPDFEKQIRIPGFKEEFEKWDKDVMLNPKVLWQDAYIGCIKCGKPLDNSLADAKRREWVAGYPSRSKDHSSYSVMPFDLIKYNSTKNILKQVESYDRRQDYFNFVHGLEYTSKDTQISQKLVKELERIALQYSASGTCLGIDVGKELHIIAGKKVGGKYIIFNVFRLSINDGSLIDQVIKVIKDFRATKIVIDSQPDISLPEALVARFGSSVHPCAYAENNNRKVQYFEIDEERMNIVSCQRTKAFDILVREVNNGKFEFPISDEMELAREHFKGMKRVEHFDRDHEKVARWVKTGADHYMHALMYFKLACDIQYGTGSGSIEAPMPRIITGASLPGTLREVREVPKTEDLRKLLSRYGIR